VHFGCPKTYQRHCIASGCNRALFGSSKMRCNATSTGGMHRTYILQIAQTYQSFQYRGDCLGFKLVLLPSAISVLSENPGYFGHPRISAGFGSQGYIYICCASPLCDLHVYCFLIFPYHITTLSPSTHCLGSLAGVIFYIFFTQRTSLKYSCMLVGDVGCWRPQCMLALFLFFLSNLCFARCTQRF